MWAVITLLGGANALDLETGAGQQEIVQAGAAELIAAGRYRPTRLLRGQRGTAGAMVPTGARVVNRARWPQHPLWNVVADVIGTDLAAMRSGVVPEDVKDANRTEHQRMLDAQILGLLVSRAAAGGIAADDFEGFLKQHLLTLKEASTAHPRPIDERLAKADARYRFR